MYLSIKHIRSNLIFDINRFKIVRNFQYYFVFSEWQLFINILIIPWQCFHHPNLTHIDNIRIFQNYTKENGSRINNHFVFLNFFKGVKNSVGTDRSKNNQNRKYYKKYPVNCSQSTYRQKNLNKVIYRDIF